MSQELKILYQRMADLTAPECANVCAVPHSCCDELACQITKSHAKEEYGIDLPEYPPNQKGTLYLGPNGCTVEPYLRPHCTLHTCQINGLGFKPNDTKWTKEYFKLRRKIELAEFGRMQDGDQLERSIKREQNKKC